MSGPGRRALAELLIWVIRAWVATLRLKIAGDVPNGPALLALRHGDQLALIKARPRGLVVPVSLSADGRLQAQILTRLGLKTVDGSSSRGGALAARSMLRALRGGAVVAIAVDGPRGPLGVVKPGIVRLAQWSGAPVVAIGIEARGRRLRRTWDQFLLPWPFSRVTVRLDAATLIPADADEGAACSALEARLEALSNPR